MSKNKMAQNLQDEIIKEFGFENLSDEKQQKVIDMMTDSIIKQVLLDSYEKLSDSDREIFEDMMQNIEDLDPNSIEEFLKEKLTDYDGIVTNAIEDLKKDMGDIKI
jgi:lipoate-protein ligase A